MLDAAGVSLSAVTTADVRLIVETFRRFVALPVEDVAPPSDDGDAVLAQFGTYDLRGRPEFSADLTRQFIEAGVAGAPMWQLSCTLYWASTAATDALASGQLWSSGKSLDEFFVEARALPGWAWALGTEQASQGLTVTLDET